jgi:hypothetical protein
LLIFTLNANTILLQVNQSLCWIACTIYATHTVDTLPPYSFTAALTSTDVTLREIIPTGTATLSGYSAADIYATSAPIESAILAVSVEVFQSRVAAGGQIEGVDFTARRTEWVAV